MRINMLLYALILLSQVSRDTPSYAQDMPSDAVVSPITSGGVKTGCSIQYTTISRDHIYMRGAPVGITGTLAWMNHKKQGIAVMMKLLAADVDEKSGSPKPFQISHAFVTINNRTLQVEEQFQCDHSAGFCGSIGFDNAMLAMTDLAKGGEVVAFGFNRAPKGLDVSIVVPTLNAAQNQRFNGCMLDILQDAQSKIEGADSAKH
jgi:hypothetical protein